MGRGVRIAAVLGMVLGAVALWPRGSQLEAEVAPEAAPLPDLPPPVRVDAPPPLVRLAFDVHPDDEEGRTACSNTLHHILPPRGPQRVLDEVGAHTYGLPWLIARASPLRHAPPPAIRRTLGFVGLRPATLGGWMADLWPGAAVAGLVAEERWAHAEWSEDVLASTPPGQRPQRWPRFRSESVLELGSRLASAGEPWVRRVGTAYAVPHLEVEERQRWALDLLATDSDPTALALAVRALSVPFVELTAADERLLRRMVRDHPEHAAALAGFGARASFAAQGCSDSWLPELELGLQHAPDAWIHGLLDRGIHELRGQLAARGHGSVDSWESGLVVLANDCADPVVVPRTVEASGIHDGSWRWRWTSEDPFTRCVESTVPPGPPPPVGQRVELQVRLVPPRDA